MSENQASHQIEDTIAAIGKHIGSVNDVSKMMDEANGAPNAFLKRHGIPVPAGITVTTIRVFTPEHPVTQAVTQETHQEAAARRKDRYVGKATWDDGHSVCHVYERPNGSQYEVCYCQ